MAWAIEVLLFDSPMLMMSSMYQVAVHSDVFYVPVLVQKCSSTSNPAARMVQAAALNSRFKCRSCACIEIEGVMEISDFFFKVLKSTAVVVPDAAGFLACTSRHDYKSLL